jgi:cell cycle related kinase
VFPQGLGFVLVFEFMVSDLSEMIRDASNPLTKAQVKTVFQTVVSNMFLGF